MLGDTTACERALGRAEQHFVAVDPGTALPWAAHVNTAEFTAQQGHTWYLLSATQPDAAVSVGRRALEEITRTSSRRVYQRLRMLDDCLAGHRTADVAELRHDIQTVCAW